MYKTGDPRPSLPLYHVLVFTITLHRCCTKSPFSKWLEWMRGHSIWGRRTMQALAVMELAFSPTMGRGGPFAEWDIRKLNVVKRLLGNEHFFRPHDFAFTKVEFSVSLAICLVPLFSTILSPPPSLSQYSVPLATVSKVPIPKGWRRGPVMSCMHNSTPVIHALFSPSSLSLSHFSFLTLFIFSCYTPSQMPLYTSPLSFLDFPLWLYYTSKTAFSTFFPARIKFPFDLGITLVCSRFWFKLVSVLFQQYGTVTLIFSLAVKRQTVELPSVHSVHDSLHLLHV